MKKYINADELVEHLNSTIVMLEREMQGYAFADGMRRAYEVVREEVMKMPPAEVREVVHSEWIQNDNGTWSCKRCHSWIPNEQHEYARYCLCCGAKMDDD